MEEVEELWRQVKRCCSKWKEGEELRGVLKGREVEGVEGSSEGKERGMGWRKGRG